VLSRLLFTVSTGFSDGIQLAIVFNKTEIKLTDKQLLQLNQLAMKQKLLLKQVLVWVRQ